MNPSPWLQPWRLARLAAASALCLALSAPPASAQAPVDGAPPSLKQVLDAAWQRSIDAAESQGRQAKARAEQAAAQSWLAAPAAVSASQREGRAGLPAGARETELGLALPLWRPGQRAAGGEASDAELAWAEASEQAQRLRLAGQLREAAGATRLAAVEVVQAHQQVETLHRLADDVERRVQAGDLAPADSLAARAELLAAEAQWRRSQQTLQAQRAAWRLLTGFDAQPAGAPATSTPQDLPDAHPELRLADAALALSQRRLALARLQRGEAPELSIGLRQERPGGAQPSQQSVVVGLRVPFGGQVHQQPRIAAALADDEVARAQQRRTRERLTAELTLAAELAQASQAQAALERDRAVLLRERAQLIDKSFRAGETPLPDLLRALGAAALADAASARQQASHQLALDRLQQALGNLP